MRGCDKGRARSGKIEMKEHILHTVAECLNTGANTFTLNLGMNHMV